MRVGGERKPIVREEIQTHILKTWAPGYSSRKGRPFFFGWLSDPSPRHGPVVSEHACLVVGRVAVMFHEHWGSPGPWQA